MAKLKRWVKKYWGLVAELVGFLIIWQYLINGVTSSGWLPGWREEPFWYVIKGTFIFLVAIVTSGLISWAISKVWVSWREA